MTFQRRIYDTRLQQRRGVGRNDPIQFPLLAQRESLSVLSPQLAGRGIRLSDKRLPWREAWSSANLLLLDPASVDLLHAAIFS